MSHGAIKIGKLTPLLMLLGLSMGGWLPLNAAAEGITAGAMPAAASVTTYTFTSDLPWFGRMESTRTVDIPARTNGTIVNIGTADETEVRQGDVLFVLAGSMVEGRMADLRKQLGQAEREVDIAKRNLRLKRSQRRQELATNEQVNAAENALSLARAHASRAKQALASLSAGARIIAPADGIFTARRVHLGQYVTPGMVLARVVNLRSVRIRASLFPPHGLNPTGLTANVHALHGLVQHGLVTRIMPERSPEGGVQIWIEGDGLQELAPGMQVSGEISVRRSSLAVPERAIARDDQGQAYVFIKTNQGFRKQSVETGLHEDGLTEITSGLKGKEMIAVDNVYELLYRDFNKVYRTPD